jgi:hypothetical protein
MMDDRWRRMKIEGRERIVVAGGLEILLSTSSSARYLGTWCRGRYRTDSDRTQEVDYGALI